MLEQPENEKRVRGFAGLIEKVLMPLNENEEFQEKFKDVQRKYVLNASNLKFAAIITINNGSLWVESVPNDSPANLSKENLGWDGYLEMDSQTFLRVAMDRISLIGVGLKWITGKIKLKGLLKLIMLLKIFKLLG